MEQEERWCEMKDKNQKENKEVFQIKITWNILLSAAVSIITNLVMLRLYGLL